MAELLKAAEHGGLAQVAFSRTLHGIGRWSDAGPASAQVRSVEARRKLAVPVPGNSPTLESEARGAFAFLDKHGLSARRFLIADPAFTAGGGGGGA